MEDLENNIDIIDNKFNNLQPNTKKLIIIILYIVLILLVVLLGYIYGGAAACNDVKGLYTYKLNCVTGAAMYNNNNLVVNYAWLNTTLN
jgi:hypothetical protein|tara:strand:- start:524 stop:790 length:267 start_codon:yes stop_codon:yes gene_type:complete